VTEPPPVAFAVPDVDATDHEAVERVLRSRWLTTGEECLRLEEELAAYVGTPHVVAVSSCTTALEIALTWLDLPAGARVGVPDWTFVSTALAAHRAGLDVVLLDSDPDTLNVSPAAVEAALAEGLDALVPVHFGGVAVAPEVRALAAAAGVPVIEDAAHALGTRDERGLVNGRDVAAACYSFYATKNLSCGEGGAIATFDQGLADFSRSWRLHGLSKDAWARYRPGAPVGASLYELVGPGLKANLPDLLAALARSQLARFPAMQAVRRRLVAAYREALAPLPVQCVPGKLDETGADHLMVVVLPEGVDRGEVVRAMAAAGVATSVHFQPLHGFTWVAEHAHRGPAGLEVTTALAPRVLSLPLHTSLSETDVERVVSTLGAALGPAGG
jgi:dTDP-4-amino-4,6-dideoxygalactose transaminase